MEVAVVEKSKAREFRDVVFEDVGFECNSLLTLKTEGVGTAHLKLILVRGFKLVC